MRLLHHGFSTGVDNLALLLFFFCFFLREDFIFGDALIFVFCISVKLELSGEGAGSDI